MCWLRGGFGGLPAGDRRIITGHPSDMTVDLGEFREVLGQYVLMTFLVFVGLMLTGVDGPFAAMLALVTIATGGFLPFDGALEDHAGPLAQLVMAGGLALGTVSVFWRRRMIRSPRHFLTVNPETGLIAIAILAVALLFAARIFAVSGGADLGPILAEKPADRNIADCHKRHRKSAGQ